jgi:two-component system chemotaxis response regulator CheY
MYQSLMPEYDGLYAIEKIREFDPHGKIILVYGSRFERNALGDTKGNYQKTN